DEDLTFEDEGLVRLRRDLGDVPPVPSPTLHEDEEVVARVEEGEDDDEEEEEPGFLTRVKRQFFGGLWGSNDADTTHDDEDMGSGGVEGSGDQQRTFRCKLHLLTPWQPVYSDKRSTEYTRTARSIQQAMVSLLISVPGEKIIQVSDMKQARGSGNILVTVDIMHDDETDQKNRMRQLVREQLRRGSLGSSPVNAQFFSFEEPRAPPIPRACPPEKHRCPGGQCAGRCDGINECVDGSDEHNCPVVGVDVGSLVTSINTESTSVPPEGCRGDAHFTCVGGVTICEVQQCDGNEDCPQGDDEQGCGCDAGSFECDGLRCLTNDRMCDGVQDCADNTDEKNCTPPPPTCSGDASGPHLCQDGSTYACFCDQKVECPGGEDEDEDRCFTGCDPGTVPCDFGTQCIPETQFCDNVPHCQDGTDERDCPTIPHAVCGGKKGGGEGLDWVRKGG
ncbi:hypothetical protein Pmani_029601, partial [Petrolisthes manimaculis]